MFSESPCGLADSEIRTFNCAGFQITSGRKIFLHDQSLEEAQ